MTKSAIAVTNNPKVLESKDIDLEVIFIDSTSKDVLIKVRDYIHKGHRLLTHPLAGSVKPNETPYETVLVSSKSYGEVDLDSLTLIENSMSTLEKFLNIRKIPDWSYEVLEDLKLIDYDLIFNYL